jgi:hypothetical protein
MYESSVLVSPSIHAAAIAFVVIARDIPNANIEKIFDTLFMFNPLIGNDTLSVDLLVLPLLVVKISAFLVYHYRLVAVTNNRFYFISHLRKVN